MKQEHDAKNIRENLEIELAGIQFTEQLQKTVLDRACPPSFWNRELRIPGIAVVLVLCMCIAVPVIGWQRLSSSVYSPQTMDAKPQPESSDRLIMIAGGVYYESELLEGWSKEK